MFFSKTHVLTLSLAFMATPSNAQLSRVLARGGSDVRTFANLLLGRNDTNVWQPINSLWNSISILTSDEDDFEGTAFIPLNEVFLSLQDTDVYKRVFENEAFGAHLEQTLYNHLVPGESGLQYVDLVDDSANEKLETVTGETLDANSVAASIVQRNLNSDTVVGHKIDRLLLPSFWDVSVRDIVGHSSLTSDGIYTVYLPPIVEKDACTSFWEAHIVVDEVITEPPSEDVTVTKTTYANNGIVHRVAQSLPYGPCSTETPTSEPTRSPTKNPTKSPTTRTPTTSAPSRSPLTQTPGSNGLNPVVDPALDTNAPVSLSTEAPVAPATPIGNSNAPVAPTRNPSAAGSDSSLNNNTITGIAQEPSDDMNYLPIIAGVAVASCLIAMGVVVGLICSRQRKEHPRPKKQTSALPSNFFDAPTVNGNDNNQNAEGFTLDPSINEPSLLTLPNFTPYNDNKLLGDLDMDA